MSAIMMMTTDPEGNHRRYGLEIRLITLTPPHLEHCVKFVYRHICKQFFRSNSYCGQSELSALDEAGSLQVTIYPNPATGNATVVLPDDIGEYKLSVINTQGRSLSRSLGPIKWSI